MEDKDKKKLVVRVSDEVTAMFESILDYSQIACPDPNTFKALRGKILRAGNDCIRTITTDLDEYTVRYVATKDDLILIQEAMNE